MNFWNIVSLKNIFDKKRKNILYKKLKKLSNKIFILPKKGSKDNEFYLLIVLFYESLIFYNIFYFLKDSSKLTLRKKRGWKINIGFSFIKIPYVSLVHLSQSDFICWIYKLLLIIYSSTTPTTLLHPFIFINFILHMWKYVYQIKIFI